MKFLKYLLPVAVVFCGGVLRAQQEDEGYSTEKEAKQRDFEALQEYIKGKRAISVKDKGGNMTISGDIRGEYYYMHAKTQGKDQRGWSTRKLYPNSAVNKIVRPISKKAYQNLGWLPKAAYRKGRDDLKPPIGTAELDVEANLFFEYIAERGWGTIQLQFSNPAGIVETDRKALINDSRKALYGSGKLNNIVLRKCFGGYNIWEEGTSRFDLEIGRRRLYDVFDSEIQFGSYFDGLTAKLSNSFEGVTDLSVKAAAFVIDYTVNHWGYVGEVGFLNIVDTGVDLKYSLINWDRHMANRWGQRHPLGGRYTNSQFTAAYNVSPDLISLKTRLYGAFLINHSAKASHWTHHLKANKAFYLGFQVGEAVRKGEYAVGLTYQWVQAQAVSERDISGLCRDNPRGISFLTRRCGGFANYKGWRLETLYALTDNWTLNAHFDRVREENRHIGGEHKSYELYLAAIFAF